MENKTEAINKNSNSVNSQITDHVQSHVISDDCNHTLLIDEKVTSNNRNSADIMTGFYASGEVSLDAGNPSAYKVTGKTLEKNSCNETIDDLIASFDDPDYYTKIDEYLDRMPYSRKSVDELLDAVKSWDLPQLFEKLLSDFEQLLTDEEADLLKRRFKETFDLLFVSDKWE